MPRTVITADLDVESLIPTQDHVLVKVLDRDVTAGGILLPKNAATACRVAKVISRGKAIPNAYDGNDFPIKVEPGEHVMFMDYAGEKLRAFWRDYRLIREHGLWAKVEFGAGHDVIDFEKIEPWADRLVLERQDESMTKSGLLHLPNAHLKIAWNLATVKWSGFGVWHQPTAKLLPCECQPGDKVIFKRYSGEDLRVRGKEYRITQEVDVVAIIDHGVLRPLRNKVVIERKTADSKTKGGLLIPDTAKTKHVTGTVVSVGGVLLADGDLHPSPLEAGDQVLFKETPGTEIVHDGREFVIMDQSLVLAKVE